MLNTLTNRCWNSNSVQQLFYRTISFLKNIKFRKLIFLNEIVRDISNISNIQSVPIKVHWKFRKFFWKYRIWFIHFHGTNKPLNVIFILHIQEMFAKSHIIAIKNTIPKYIKVKILGFLHFLFINQSLLFSSYCVRKRLLRS